MNDLAQHKPHEYDKHNEYEEHTKYVVVYIHVSPFTRRYHHSGNVIGTENKHTNMCPKKILLAKAEFTPSVCFQIHSGNVIEGSGTAYK